MTLPKQHRDVLLQSVTRYPCERDPALARGLAARKPDGELPRYRLRVLLEGLEEGAYLVEEDRALRKLGFELGVAS
jgi:hypothetical protein